MTRQFAQRPLLAIALLAAFGTAQAHQLWIEQDAQGAKLYFGEYGDNLREASPGLLDKFVRPTAHRLTASEAKAAEVSKTADGFAIASRAETGESLVAEEATYPLSERKEGDKTVRSLYMPAARWIGDVNPRAPRLTLDLVPTGPAGPQGVELQATYKGQPLPKAKVAVVTASGWMQEHHTDAAGKFSVQLPWRGTYVLEMSHRDNSAGERANGDKYDRASYVTSLTLVHNQGLVALPAAAPAAPNKAN